MIFEFAAKVVKLSLSKAVHFVIKTTIHLRQTQVDRRLINYRTNTVVPLRK
jgi:hypothetical protein